MINGEKNLRRVYLDLDEEQYQPAGIDLTLDKVSEFKYNKGMTYGLLKNAKVLPDVVDMDTKTMQVSGMLVDVFVLQPHTTYLATTTEFIDIDEKSGQFYLPRSSLLRSSIDVCTAFGDPGFHGHLSFLLINHTDELFVIEKGARFAQLIDINVIATGESYDGDYNE